MKKTFSLLLVLFCSLTLLAERFEYNGIYYNTLSDSTAEVTFQTEWSSPSYNHTSVIIPSTAEYNGQIYSIVRIGQAAFYEYTSLTSLSIPKTVTTIDIGAFFGCTNLSKVLITASVQTIGSGAFGNCTSLEEVICLATIPPTSGALLADPEEIFYGVDVANILLYVPIESIELYRNADQWKDFQIRVYYGSEECYEYMHVNLTALPLITGKLTYRLSTDDGSEIPYVDSVWIFDTEQQPLQKFHAQSGDTIDLSFLERGTYILRVYIDECMKSRTFVHRPKWKYTWCDTWNVLSHGWDPEGGDGMYNAHTIIYQLEGDSLIDEVTYQKLTGHVSFASPATQEYVAALRFVDNKKVFIHYDNTEYLLYDFGAQVGDTLEIFGGIDYYEDYKILSHVVTEIDTLEDGRLQMQLVVELQWSTTITWIEGIGSRNGIVHNIATDRIGSGTDVLLCAYRDNECIYTTSSSYYAPYGCVYNDPIFSATKEVKSPTPSAQKIMYNGQLLILRDGKTYNVMGQEL